MSLKVSLQRNLSLLSPRSWIGIYNALCNQISNSDVILYSLGTWIRYIFLHFLLLITLAAISDGPSSSGAFRRLSTPHLCHTAGRAAIATCISPLVISQTIEIIPHAKMVASRLWLWKTLRMEADQDALVALSTGIQTGSVARSARADFFFPCANREYSVNKQKAMILIPGFCVDHTAYASIASRIASEGNMIVAVLCLEPLRIADKYLVDMRELKNCMKNAEILWRTRCVSNNHEIEWCIGGHSYGGYAAMRLAPSLAAFHNKSNFDKLKIIVWAAGDRKQFLTDLSLREDLDVLILFGSRDDVCNLTSDNNDTRRLKAYLPQEAKFECIEGANHNNFASYNGMTSRDFISREVQHREVTHKTIGFVYDGSSITKIENAD